MALVTFLLCLGEYYELITKMFGYDNVLPTNTGKDDEAVCTT